MRPGGGRKREAEVGPQCGVENGFLWTGIAHIPKSRRGEIVMSAAIAGFPQLAPGQDDRLIDVVAFALLADDCVYAPFNEDLKS